MKSWSTGSGGFQPVSDERREAVIGQRFTPRWEQALAWQIFCPFRKSIVKRTSSSALTLRSLKREKLSLPSFKIQRFIHQATLILSHVGGYVGDVSGNFLAVLLISEKRSDYDKISVQKCCSEK
ncbi:hypothetical protein CEXT_141711 [Caerostris extrusa]|uniref:Uncharacterized protein n=1 Tax=Caerostris extrusa TaxID=172846 RepID=A0AAV4SRH5_CAEEX|nr:hypothetical protein CEXT_141711 [Caerostris extrusa]